MSVVPLKETINIYNRTQQVSRVEQLRAPAIVADYQLNRGDFINKDLLNASYEAEGIKAGSSVSIVAGTGSIQINAGNAVYRNFIFNVPTPITLSTAAMPLNSTWFLVLKIVEKRFTSGATSGGNETDDNALEGVPGNNPYGNLWPEVMSGYDPGNCLQIDVNGTSLDDHNDWRFKWSWSIQASVPVNENPIASKFINRFYTAAATVIKNNAGTISVNDTIYTNRVALRDKNNLFVKGQSFQPSTGVSIIPKSATVPPAGLITGQVLKIDGSSNFYVLDLDSSQIGTYNPLTGFIAPGIDFIPAIPNGGNGFVFSLYIKSGDLTKRLSFNSVFPSIPMNFPLIFQVPTLPNITLNLYAGSITTFAIVDNNLQIISAENYLTKTLYGDTAYTNVNLYNQYVTHKAALESLANEIYNSNAIDLTRLYRKLFYVYSAQGSNFGEFSFLNDLETSATRSGNMVHVQGHLVYALYSLSGGFDQNNHYFVYAYSDGVNFKCNPVRDPSVTFSTGGYYIGQGTVFIMNPDSGAAQAALPFDMAGTYDNIGVADFYATSNNTVIVRPKLSDRLFSTSGKSYLSRNEGGNQNYRIVIQYTLNYRTVQL